MGLVGWVDGGLKSDEGQDTSILVLGAVQHDLWNVPEHLLECVGI